jgi:hypothetical protein
MNVPLIVPDGTKLYSVYLFSVEIFEPVIATRDRRQVYFKFMERQCADLSCSGSLMQVITGRSERTRHLGGKARVRSDHVRNLDGNQQI